jgi:hypothetical protein
MDRLRPSLSAWIDTNRDRWWHIVPLRQEDWKSSCRESDHCLPTMSPRPNWTDFSFCSIRCRFNQFAHELHSRTQFVFCCASFLRNPAKLNTIPLHTSKSALLENSFYSACQKPLPSLSQHLLFPSVRWGMPPFDLSIDSLLVMSGCVTTQYSNWQWWRILALSFANRCKQIRSEEIFFHGIMIALSSIAEN